MVLSQWCWAAFLRHRIHGLVKKWVNALPDQRPEKHPGTSDLKKRLEESK